MYPVAGLYPGGDTPYTGRPSFTVQIGWSSAQAGLLRFGFSTFQTVSGVVQTTDVFGNAFSSFFNGTYDDVTSDVQSIRVRRGRDDILSQINAGTAEIEFMRPTDRAYWNPSNKSSLLNSANAPGFVPMRPIRITSSYAGATVGIYWGFIRSARFDYASGVCRVSCADLFLVMSRVNPLDPAVANTTAAGTDNYNTDTATSSDVTQATTTLSSRSGLVRLA